MRSQMLQDEITKRYLSIAGLEKQLAALPIHPTKIVAKGVTKALHVLIQSLHLARIAHCRSYLVQLRIRRRRWYCQTRATTYSLVMLLWGKMGVNIDLQEKDLTILNWVIPVYYLQHPEELALKPALCVKLTYQDGVIPICYSTNTRKTKKLPTHTTEQNCIPLCASISLKFKTSHNKVIEIGFRTNPQAGFKDKHIFKLSVPTAACDPDNALMKDVTNDPFKEKPDSAAKYNSAIAKCYELFLLLEESNWQVASLKA